METPRKTIRVALAGNPNSGKTSVFNMLTGLHQQVGNWPGVTVERKAGHLEYAGYQIEFVDLPGTYSLTSYSIEERIARQYILEEQPDVIIDVVDAANLDGNLFLTTQLLEMGVDVIVDLNMWDEFERSDAQLDIRRFEELLGAPAVTTVAHRGQGRQELLQAVIRLVEDRSERHRHIPVTFGTRVEDVLVKLSRRLEESSSGELGVPSRYLAAKLLEGDAHIVEMLHNRLPKAKALLLEVEGLRAHVQQSTRLEASRVIAEGRYGFIDGLLRETLISAAFDRMEFSRQLDRVLTHRILGLPIFVGFMWLLFSATFTLGAHPTGWLEIMATFFGDCLRALLPSGFVADLLVEGIIGGVGSVAVFLPSIMILFLGISILEDSGYMARVAFIMDRVMHIFGLHGKSFIPMLMGFGCTVPAIMATRTLESQRDRVLTTLLLPNMSCAARLPVYVLFAGAFFGAHAGNVVMLMYLLGILTALGLGIIFSRTIFRHEAVSFVMELPPYRWPTARGLLGHMWERSWVYIKKMGGLILIASAVLWILGSVPHDPRVDLMEKQIARLEASSAPQEEIDSLIQEKSAVAIEYTVIGRLGKLVVPVIAPLGFDWRMGVSLVTGFVAKEVVVSSMGVLYHVGDEAGEESESLRKALQDPRFGITPLVAFAFMVFVLLYVPCIVAVVAIRREIGARWMWFDIGYQVSLAWVAAFVVYQGGRLLGLE
ncbi:MAG: ferrous iron transport protein B [Candidatus Eisenbacteria sp.]|nr:ferrous iron transport protein B [Candidatus Eisenbacteria bacterium]